MLSFRVSSRRLVAVLVLLCSCVGLAFPPTTAEEVHAWSERQFEKSLNRIIHNIEEGQRVPGAHPGAIIASPGVVVDHANGETQDYRFHWVRDGALVIRSLIRALKSTPAYSSKIAGIVERYIDLTRVHQASDSPYGLGEVKFYPNGHRYEGPWGRPQNDGPALRALALMGWYDVLIGIGRTDEARALFNEVIRKDLQYCADNFKRPSFDIWEEVFGMHFYLLQLQSAALDRGARILNQMSDLNGAQTFVGAAREARDMMGEFLDHKRNVITATRKQTAGSVWDKTLNLDVAVLLGSLYSHGLKGGGVADAQDFSPVSPWMLGTANELREQFEKAYPINQYGFPGTLLGRYPEDRYFGGNPWPIATLAMEIYFRFVISADNSGVIEVVSQNIGFLNKLIEGFADLSSNRLVSEATNRLEEGATNPVEASSSNLVKTGTTHSNVFRLEVGERILRGTPKFMALQDAALHAGRTMLSRLRFHMGEFDELYEQIDRHTGYPKALPHLTWSHAAFLDAIHALHAAEDVIRKRPAAPSASSAAAKGGASTKGGASRSTGTSADSGTYPASTERTHCSDLVGG